jgi:hypothetical protein
VAQRAHDARVAPEVEEIIPPSRASLKIDIILP